MCQSSYFYIVNLFVQAMKLTCAALLDGSLKSDNYAPPPAPPRQMGPAPPRQMGRTRQKEKQSTRTVRPKIVRAKGYKKRRRETREDFSREEKYMHYRRPRATKGKTLPILTRKENGFPVDGDS
jgi:hypothetical protein